MTLNRGPFVAIMDPSLFTNFCFQPTSSLILKEECFQVSRTVGYREVT